MNRPLSKLADTEKAQGASSAQQPNVYEVLKGASAGATQQFAAAVEGGKRFHHDTVSADHAKVVTHANFRITWVWLFPLLALFAVAWFFCKEWSAVRRSVL